MLLLFATSSCPTVEKRNHFHGGDLHPMAATHVRPRCNWGRPKPSTAWISQGHLTIARSASAWIPTHNRTARLTSTTVQHTWRSVKGTKKNRHDWSHDNMPHIPLTCLWCRLGSAPRQNATYASSAKLATLPTCLTQALRPIPHAAKQGLLTEL